MRFVVRLLLLVLFLGACGSPPPADKPTPLPIAQPIGSGMPLATPPPDEPGNSYDDDAKIPVAKDDPVRGPSNALVTLVLFSDFQCPFCSRFTPTLERAREEFGDDLRIVFKNQPLPFHQHAKLAAEVGAAVMATRGNEAFWRYHDMAFRGQQAIGPDAIRQWAIAAGAEPDALESAIVRHTYAGKIDRDQDLAKKVGAFGTPASYINGRELSGAQPFEKLSEIIHEERVKAKQLADNGVPRKMIYFRAVANNFTEKKPVADEEPDPDANVVFKVPVGSSPVRGKATALVTIVEFADFQCPYCKRVEPTLKKIQSEYGESTVRIVFKDEPLPFHPRALPAANLARFVRQQKGDAAFWEVHDRLFDSQPKLEDSDLESIARASGVDVGRAMAAVKGKTFEKAIGLDEDLGDDVQATGTPHFFINGRRLVGAQPFEKFKEVIDAELAKAQAMVKSGTPAASVYDTIIRDGKGAPEPERKTVPASATAAFQGPANAPVVIQEFSDFQCPFCQRVEATLDDLMKAYPGKIKLVWRDKPLPMHPDAPLAAEAAREALAQKGNDGFRKMREQLFTHQRDADGLKRPALEGYARTIGLDVTKFNKALDNRIHQAAVDADAKVADDAGISGTPAFVIGPYFLSGAQPLQKFKKLVDRTLNPPPAPKVAPTTTTATGLGIQDIVVGTGKTAKAGDKLTVHYTGTLTNGSVFDSSRTHGKPFDFTLGGGQVIKGWDQGLVGMKVGGRRKLTIPPDLAYGDRGVGTTIPPKSTLVFDVELLSIP